MFSLYPVEMVLLYIKLSVGIIRGSISVGYWSILRIPSEPPHTHIYSLLSHLALYRTEYIQSFELLCAFVAFCST